MKSANFSLLVCYAILLAVLHGCHQSHAVSVIVLNLWRRAFTSRVMVMLELSALVALDSGSTAREGDGNETLLRFGGGGFKGDRVRWYCIHTQSRKPDILLGVTLNRFAEVADKANEWMDVTKKGYKTRILRSAGPLRTNETKF